MDTYYDSKLHQTPLAHACAVHSCMARGTLMSHGSMRHANAAAMQVQLPQFRKAGLEVTAVFSRGQQRARQVAEQASTPQTCFPLLSGLFSAKRASMQNGIKHCFSSAEDLCLCEEGIPFLIYALLCYDLSAIHSVSGAVDVVSVVTPPYLHCKQFLGEEPSTAACTMGNDCSTPPSPPHPPPSPALHPQPLMS